MNHSTEIVTLATAEENGVTLHACATPARSWLGGYKRFEIVAGPDHQILVGWEVIIREAGSGYEGGMRLAFGKCPAEVETLVREHFGLSN